MSPELLNSIDRHYGSDARNEFFRRMEEAGLGGLFRLPLLAPEGAPPRSQPRGLSVANESTTAAASFSARMDFSELRTLREAFDAFNSVTHNVITLGDLRTEPAYFARVYRDSVYFLHHGDGFCSALAFLFQGFARKLLGEEVELRYCRTPDGAYTHAYGVQGDQLVDPALKTFAPLASLESQPPNAWFYTLLKRGGMARWQEIAEADLAWLYPRETIEYMRFMESGNHQLVYRSDAKFAEVHRVFFETVRDRSESMSLERDDFAWKPTYRGEAARFASRAGERFFAQLDRPVRYDLPPGGTFRLGPRARGQDPLLDAVEDVFYGRVFGWLRASAPSDGTLLFKTPDIPWILEFEADAQASLRVNGRAPTKVGPGSQAALRRIGLAELWPAASAQDQAEGYAWQIEAKPGSVVSLGLACNALAWDSPFLRLEATSPNARLVDRRGRANEPG